MLHGPRGTAWDHSLCSICTSRGTAGLRFRFSMSSSLSRNRRAPLFASPFALASSRTPVFSFALPSPNRRATIMNFVLADPRGTICLASLRGTAGRRFHFLVSVALAEPQVAAFLVSFALAAPQGNVLTHAFRFAEAEFQGTAASPSRRRGATILLAEPQGTIFLVCSVHAEPQDNATQIRIGRTGNLLNCLLCAALARPQGKAPARCSDSQLARQVARCLANWNGAFARSLRSGRPSCLPSC